MKFDFNSNVRSDDWPKPGEPFTPKFIQNYSTMVAELAKGLQGGLTFADNMASVWMTQSMTHDTSVSFYNPLSNKAAPKAVKAMGAALYPIQSDYFTFSPSTNLISFKVKYDTASPSGKNDTVTLLVIGG